MIVVLTFQSSLLGIKSPRSGLKLDPFRERATSRYGEGAAFHLGDALFTLASRHQGNHAVRANKDTGAAELPDASPHTPSVHTPAPR
jgi:hypothetical protein